MAFTPLNHGEHVRVHQEHLPHWRQWGRTYFITARLADSVPAAVSKEWRAKRDAWLEAHGIASTDELPKLSEDHRHEYQREFTARFHELLDAGHGACVLAQDACAGILTTRLVQGHDIDYRLDAWVIMPNHLHALVEPFQGAQLGKIVQSWKGGSAREINLMLQRAGQLWQHEPFDHIVRSEAQCGHFRRYIARNPEKAGLKRGFVLGIGSEQGLLAQEMLKRWDPK